MRIPHPAWIILALLCGAAWAAFAQSSCHSELMCPDGSLPQGDFPNCTCGEPPPPEPPPPPPPEPEPEPAPPDPVEPDRGPFDGAGPTCEANFGCATGDQIGFGDWPDCSCRDLETPTPIPGLPIPENPGVNPGLGMEDTCKMFFECAPHYEMLVWNGRCVCGERMLEPPAH